MLQLPDLDNMMLEETWVEHNQGIILFILKSNLKRFGTGGRAGLAKVSDEPGPGYYNIPSAIGNVQKYHYSAYNHEKRNTMTDRDTSFKGIFG